MSTPDTRDLEAAALRERLAELSRALEASRRTERRLVETERRLRNILEMTSEMIIVTAEGVFVETNERFRAFFGYEERELVGSSSLVTLAPEARAEVKRKIASRASGVYETVGMKRDGSRVALEVCGKSILHRGRLTRVTAMRDITERKRVEEAIRRALVEREVVRAQEAILAELATPLLPIAEGVVVLPLVGMVNAERARQVQRALVEGVARHRARTAILDITGAPDVDAQVADALLRAARATKLLGAEVIVTGIRPEVAQRFIALGADLRGIVTYGTLQRGVAHALARP